MYCQNCKQDIEILMVGKNGTIYCSFCGSENVVDYADFQFPKMDNLVSNMGISKDSFKAAFDSCDIVDLWDETCGSCNDCEFIKCINNDKFVKMPEHLDHSCAGCESIAKCTDGIWLDEESGLPEWDSTLSFDDMDLNELALLDLPIEEVVPISYVMEMNQRFLHTFVDGCFVPV